MDKIIVLISYIKYGRIRLNYNHSAHKEVGMLILTRRVGQRIRIGDDIIIDVREVRGGQVKIGIQAPRELSVHREELYDTLQAQRVEEESRNLGAAISGLAFQTPPPENGSCGGKKHK